MSLPLFTVDLTGNHPRCEHAPQGLSNPHATQLLQLDNGCCPVGDRVVDRFLPLGDDRLAVGRRLGGRCQWVILSSEVWDSPLHGSRLWTEPDWLALRTPLKAPPTLQRLLSLSLPLHRDRQILHRLLATLIGALDTPTAPIAVVVPERLLTSPSSPCRWLILSVIALLPSSLSSTLRIAVGEPSPNPDHWDLVITDSPSSGFTLIDGLKPPTSTDVPVAAFILDALATDQLGLLAELARSHHAPEAWFSALTSLHQTADEDAIDDLPTQALDRDAQRALVASIEPWSELASLDPISQQAALQALLDAATDVSPTTELLVDIRNCVPESNHEQWIQVVFAWLQQGQLQPQLMRLLSALIMTSDVPISAYWTGALDILVQQQQYSLARDAAMGEVALHLVEQRAEATLVDFWLALPSEQQTQPHFGAFIGWLAEVDALDAVLTLFQGVVPATRAVVARYWAATSGTRALSVEDPIIDAVWHGPLLQTMLSTLVERVGGERVIRAFIDRDVSPHDTAWIILENALSDCAHYSPLERFLALHWLHPGHPALELHAKHLLHTALGYGVPSSNEVATVAMHFDALPDSSLLWRWIAVTATHPAALTESDVDAGVVQFLAEPPELRSDCELAARALVNLAQNIDYEPVDHARWVVRLTLLDEHADRDLAHSFAASFCRALRDRPDGISHVAAITNALLELGEGHPSLWFFSQQLLPALWPKGAPLSYVQALRLASVSPPLRTVVLEALHAH